MLKEAVCSKKGKIVIVIILLAIIAIVSNIARPILQKQDKYHKAIELMESGEYWDAIFYFKSVENYRDSESMITECYYREAIEAYEAENFGLTLNIIKGQQMINYKNSKKIHDICIVEEEKKEAERKKQKDERNQEIYDEAVKMVKNMSNESIETLANTYKRLLNLPHEWDTSSLSSDIFSYVVKAERVYNDYSDIAYENWEKSTTEIMRYAQDKLSQKYSISKTEVQHMFDSYMNYVKRGGQSLLS